MLTYKWLGADMFCIIVHITISISIKNASCLIVLLWYRVVLHTNSLILLSFQFGNDNSDEDMWECICQIDM